MRIAVVANCQARPVATIMARMCSSIDDTQIIIAHLSSGKKEQDELAMLRQADVIFAQFIRDRHHAGHLALSRLQAEFKDRLISWPNIFFRGHCPELSYIAVGDKKRLRGPLGEYHLQSIYSSWKAGIPAGACVDMLDETDTAYQAAVRKLAKHSLDELRSRESVLDVSISDVIEAEWTRRRLFFTFNHPKRFLLTEMASRLLKAAGLAAASPVNVPHEPLGTIIPPLFRRDVAAIGARFQAEEDCIGAELAFEGEAVTTGNRRPYAIHELVELFYKAYAVQITPETPVSFSPSFMEVQGGSPRLPV